MRYCEIRVETKLDCCIFAKSENLTKFREISLYENFFAKIQNFHVNIGIPNIFAKMLTKIFVFVNIFAKIKNFSVNVNENFHFRKHFRERYVF
jgi:hypothetical protein